MTMTPQQKRNVGSYIPTTSLFDVARLYQVEIGSPEFRELLVRLYQAVNNISLVLNTKESGYYIEEEFNTGALFFNTTTADPNQLRNEFCKAINTGALAAGTNTIAHGITVDSNFKLVQLYGGATNSTSNNYYPMNFSGANFLSLRMNGTSMIVENNTGITFDSSVVVVKFLRF